EEILMEAPKVTIRGQNGEVVYENGIVSRTTASNVQHAGGHSMTGPASATASLPGMPASTTMTNEKFIALDSNNDPVTGLKYEIQDGEGGIESSGSTGGSGDSSSVVKNAVKKIKLVFK
ncbi:MAG: type VI secretion system tip protein VgrG, partial [Proteobacteria bacterium]|nr:type VI secretion system tip protein VgrG [Pseudomonadota bacterium]